MDEKKETELFGIQAPKCERKLLSISFDRWMYDEIVRLSEAYGLSKNEIVRRIMQEKLS